MKKRSRLSVKKKVVGLFSFLLSVVPSSPPPERNSQKNNSKKKNQNGFLVRTSVIRGGNGTQCSYFFRVTLQTIGNSGQDRPCTLLTSPIPHLWLGVLVWAITSLFTRQRIDVSKSPSVINK